MARPDFTKKWASSRPSIPEIASPDYALGFANYLGAIPPSTDDHDYIMNLQDERGVWLGEQMLNAVGHEWQSDVTYDAFAVVRSPANGQLYRSLAGSNLGNEPSVSGANWAIGVQPVSVDYLNTTRIDVASAATVNLTSSAPNTRHINITGTTTITAFTVAVGQTYFVRFAGALTLTNNAGIVTQSGANITTAAGDTCIIRATAANVVELLSYTPAGGWVKSLTASGYQKLPGGLIVQWGQISVLANNSDTFFDLPIAFTATGLQVVASATGPNTAVANIGAAFVSPTQVKLNCNHTAAIGMRIIAIGY